MFPRRALILHRHTAAALLFGLLIGSASTASAQPFVSVQQCEAARQSAHGAVMAGHRAINQCMRTSPPRIGEGPECNASDQIVIRVRAWPQCGRYEYHVCEAQNRLRQIQAECQRLRAQGLEEERRQRAAEQADREARERERRQQTDRMRDGWRGWAQEAVGAGRHETSSGAGTPGALQRLHQVAARTQQAMALARSAEALTGLARGFGADPQQLDAISALFAPLLSRNPGIAAIQSIALGQVLAIYQDLFRELDGAAAAFASFSIERDMAAAFEQSAARLREVAAIGAPAGAAPASEYRALAERAEAMQRIIAESERVQNAERERQAALARAEQERRNREAAAEAQRRADEEWRRIEAEIEAAEAAEAAARRARQAELEAFGAMLGGIAGALAAPRAPHPSAFGGAPRTPSSSGPLPLHPSRQWPPPTALDPVDRREVAPSRW